MVILQFIGWIFFVLVAMVIIASLLYLFLSFVYFIVLFILLEIGMAIDSIAERFHKN